MALNPYDGLPAPGELRALPVPQEPHDLAAEQNLLGLILTGHPEGLDAVPGGDYYDTRHQELHAHLVALREAGEGVEAPALAQRLRAAKAIYRYANGVYLFELIEGAHGEVGYWARLIHEAATARSLTRTLGRAQQQLTKGHDPDTVNDVVYTALYDLVDPASRSADGRGTWSPIDLDAVLTDGDTTPPPTILARTDGNHLVYAGCVHTFSGEPTSGKTWLALLACLQQLQAGRNVVFIDFEDRAPRLAARLIQIGATRQQIVDQFTYIRPHDPLDSATKSALEPVLAKAALVIIDGVTEAMTMHGLDLEDNADAATFYDLLPRWVTRHGPACVLIDHVVKDPERQGRYGIGAQHKLAGIDGAAYLVKNITPFARGKKGAARVTIGKDREGMVEEFALGKTAAELTIDDTKPGLTILTLDAPQAMPTDDHGDARPTVLMERVSRWLEAHPGAGKNTILDEVPGKRAYVIKAVAQLVHEGLVEATPGPRNTLTHRVVEPFRTDDSSGLREDQK